MYSTAFLTSLAALSTLVAAHGRIDVATGDAGGNITALGIMGGVVPGTGRNRNTEVDTTVFRSRNAASDGLGKTTAGGKNTVDDVVRVAEMSGASLPQVSSNGGYISATYHVVTTDGAGPVQAIVDPSGTGQFSQGTQAEVMTQVPGQGGRIAPGPLRNNVGRKLLARMGLTKRAANVNQDFPLKVAIPAGMTCSGTVGSMSNVCLLKVANNNRAGPFGGVLAFQMASDGAANNTLQGQASTQGGLSAETAQNGEIAAAGNNNAGTGNTLEGQAGTQGQAGTLAQSVGAAQDGGTAATGNINTGTGDTLEGQASNQGQAGTLGQAGDLAQSAGAAQNGGTAVTGNNNAGTGNTLEGQASNQGQAGTRGQAQSAGAAQGAGIAAGSNGNKGNKGTGKALRGKAGTRGSSQTQGQGAGDNDDDDA